MRAIQTRVFIRSQPAVSSASLNKNVNFTRRLRIAFFIIYFHVCHFLTSQTVLSTAEIFSPAMLSRPDRAHSVKVCAVIRSCDVRIFINCSLKNVG